MNEPIASTASDARTLKALSAAFLAHEADRRFSSCTLRNHRCTLSAFVDWLAAREVRTADLLLKEHLELWIRHLNAHRTRRGQPLQPQSLNLHILGTKRFLAYLAVRGFVPGNLPNALQCVKAPSLLPQSVLTHAQVRTFLLGLQTGTLEGCRNRAMLELLYSSGLRASELLGLDVLNVNLDHATAIVTGKGRKQRVVPFGRTAQSCLESYLKAIRPFLLHRSEEQALFLDHHGLRLSYHTLSQLIKACARRSGLAESHVTAHTFRRSCATELLRGGANMYHVKDLLGHESLTTLRHYAKLTIVDLKKTHERCHPREQDDIAEG